MLSEKDIAEFQKIYKEQFGKEISKEDAYAKGVKLLRLVQLVYQPITQEQYNKLQQRRKEGENNKNNYQNKNIKNENNKNKGIPK